MSANSAAFDHLTSFRWRQGDPSLADGEAQLYDLGVLRSVLEEAVEIAVAEYIDWFNHRRIHGEIGYVPPAEYEAQHAPVEPSPEPVDDLVDAR